MSKYHLPEDFLKEGQEVTDSDGKKYKVLRYSPSPTVLLRNVETDQVQFGTIDSPLFRDMEFYIGDKE